MKEDFLHYLWKYQKFSTVNLFTTTGVTLQVLKVGTHNTQADGPDFSTAQLIIDNQKWAGNVEIHIKSSDWYAHNHQTDTNYDSVILHVVWEEDAEVYRQNNTKIPTLELKPYVSGEALLAYRQLYEKSKKNWINCENQLNKVSGFVWENWLERLYIERLETKCQPILELLKANKNNWEATCFCLIAKAFGGNTNGDAFFRVAQSIPFAVIQKEKSFVKLEALLLGQAGVLNDNANDSYEKLLFEEYSFLKKKHKLITPRGIKVQFFRLRPSNFPTIRLSQLAVLYTKNNNLFTHLIDFTTIKQIQDVFTIEASNYWNTHYSFGKETRSSLKKTTSVFIDIIILNALIPLRFLHMKSKGYSKETMDDLLDIMKLIKPEKNNIVSRYEQTGVRITSAIASQAVLTLHKNYCKKDRCLHCPVGVSLLDS